MSDVVIPNTFARQRLLDPDVVVWAVGQAGRWVTRAQVAAGLGISKSPRLTALLEQAVAQGRLERGRSYMPNGAVVYFYRVAGVE